VLDFAVDFQNYSVSLFLNVIKLHGVVKKYFLFILIYGNITHVHKERVKRAVAVLISVYHSNKCAHMSQRNLTSNEMNLEDCVWNRRLPFILSFRITINVPTRIRIAHFENTLYALAF
jgi:hypothetical protein